MIILITGLQLNMIIFLQENHKDVPKVHIKEQCIKHCGKRDEARYKFAQSIVIHIISCC